MCGILTVYSKKNKFIFSKQQLEKALDTLSHRGPDDKGVYLGQNVFMGQRRLSIIDLSRHGHQPMFSNDKRYIIIFNGEIYNFKELKYELQYKGIEFISQSDTEVILYGLIHEGHQYLKKLNGIFTLSFYDTITDKVIIARDRFGVKPLYTYDDENIFAVASEMKALLKLFPTAEINWQALHEFIYYGNALGENTMLSKIKKVVPGSFTILHNNNLETGLFWKHEDISEINCSNEGEIYSQVSQLLEQAVKRQLISDVPVGVFLSGGIDSSSIAAFASKHYNGKINTYSAAFDFDDGHNELPLAAEVAKLHNTNHHEIYIEGKKLPDVITDLIHYHDEPFSDAANIPLYLMTNALKNQVKVILQGDGGDEMFGGYNRYQLLHQYKRNKFAFRLANFFNPINPFDTIKFKINRFNSIFQEKDEANLFAKLLTTELTESFHEPEAIFSDKVKSNFNTTNPFKRYVELNKRFDFVENKIQRLLWIDSLVILPDQFLEKVDKSTMANSIEVRVPYLDNELSAYAMSLPGSIKLKNGKKKYILKKALEGIVPNKVLYGPKKGFGVPYQKWIKGPLKDFVFDTLFSKEIQNKEIFDYSVLEKRIKANQNGHYDYGFVIWKCLNIAIWSNKKDISFEK